MTPYYDDGTCAIYNGDCRDVADAIEPNSVDLLLTDPPYGMAFVSGRAKDGPSKAVRSDGVRQGIRIVRSGLNALEHTFHEDMHALIFYHWESWPDFYDNLCHLFAIRNAVIWYKGGGGMGDLRHEYAKDYEIILFGAKSRGREMAGKRTGAVMHHKRVSPARRHVPYQKPTELLTPLVERHCPPGGLVLDAFMGSGSTLVAAKLAGRRAVGIELDEYQCEIAATRLQAVLTVDEAAA